MKSLAEIEDAVEQLQPSELEELFLLLAVRLRSQGRGIPEPRDLAGERIAGWIRDDEEAYRAFLATE